jgi:hypothetical protein
MDEAKYRLWDTVIKVVGAVIAVSGGLVAVAQYRSTAREQYRSAQIEFVNQRLTVLSEATSVAAELAADNQGSKAKTDAAVAKFWTFYNSKSVLLEGAEVHNTLKAVVAALMKLNDGKPDTFTALQSAATAFSEACQRRINTIQNKYGKDWMEGG